MDEDNKASGSISNNAETSNTDMSIPKVNMKFDGHSWTNKKNMDNTTINSTPETSNSGAHKAAGDDKPADQRNADQLSPKSNASNDDTDGEFELTADAMVHDFDDEGTLDEEEEDDEGDLEELDDLAKEGEMPLDDLIALYYNKQNEAKSPYPDNQDTLSNDDGSKSSKNEENDSDENVELPRKLRSSTSFLSPNRQDSGDEDADRDYVPPAPEDWKKVPRVGEDYQVDMIPDRNQQTPDYEETDDQLIWDPTKLSKDKVENYLTTVSTLPSNEDTPLLPSGSHLRDNEDALFLLTQCEHDAEEAIRRYKWRPPPLSSELHVWSEEECRQFEHGLSLYGKDFHTIHHNKVKTKSIGEIVKFYYIWKKSERYDNFNAKTRLGKKKETLHPGVTDYMERLLDETEHSTSSQHSNQATSGSYPPHSHSAALQQHLVDLRVTRRQHRNHNMYTSESPSNDYSEMNGLLDSDYVDDVDMFDNIVPTLPANHVYPAVPFASLDPAINVGYTDHGQFAPIASTSHVQDAVTVGPTTANQNNNCHVGVPSTTAGTAFQSKHGFRPLEPAGITPPVDSPVTPEITRTTPLPPDVLSSIDELENVYCSSSNSNASLSQSSIQGLPIESLSADSPSESPEVAALNLKRFQCSDINGNVDRGEVKRRKLDADSDDPEQPAPAGGETAPQKPASPSTSLDLPGSSGLADCGPAAVKYQPTTQTDLPHEAISDAPRIVSC